ncbi:hypothetical protein LCGC14_1144670 [marine sediment metagenome]|uniref:DUF5678 domain-containing protein n=1 Tax=marine sediment metagenome TaxID=412755 RepID=A0A0F9Q2W1_9ZZZZ
MKWAPGQWSAVITRNGKSVGHVYGKTLKAAKAAATRKMRRGR